MARLSFTMPRDEIVASLVAGVIVGVVAIPFPTGAVAPSPEGRPATPRRQSPRLATEDAKGWRCISRGPAYGAGGAARSRAR